jgi:hypothetical protein
MSPSSASAPLTALSMNGSADGSSFARGIRWQIKKPTSFASKIHGRMAILAQRSPRKPHNRAQSNTAVSRKRPYG